MGAKTIPKLCRFYRRKVNFRSQIRQNPAESTGKSNRKFRLSLDRAKISKKSLENERLRSENHFESTAEKKFFEAKSGRIRQKRPPNPAESGRNYRRKSQKNKKFENSIVQHKQHVILLKVTKYGEIMLN